MMDPLMTMGDLQASIDRLKTHVGVLEYENSRLRTALVRIGSLSHAGEGDTVDDAVAIARQALEARP